MWDKSHPFVTKPCGLGSLKRTNPLGMGLGGIPNLPWTPSPHIKRGICPTSPKYPSHSCFICPWSLHECTTTTHVSEMPYLSKLKKLDHEKELKPETKGVYVT